jgi:hypothetical protein
VLTRTTLSELDNATDWVNSEPLTAAGLRGHVIAVQFCTYSCINWIRTIPYVRAWAGAYRDRGFVVVGAHSPEFSFEHQLEGVRRAMQAMSVEYPVVLDNEFAIWRSFGNQYWPAFYLLDGDGRVRYRHFGEGAYGDTEDAIRELVGADGDPVQVEATGVEAAADWETLRSPETYVGRLRGEGGRASSADGLALNQWALAGAWSVEDESAVVDGAGASLAFRFQARDLNLVLTPPSEPVGFTVTIDGRPPAGAHGVDIDERGAGTVSEPRLYQLVRQPEAVGEHTFEISFDGPGVRAWVFTFG